MKTLIVCILLGLVSCAPSVIVKLPYKVNAYAPVNEKVPYGLLKYKANLGTRQEAYETMAKICFNRYKIIDEKGVYNESPCSDDYMCDPALISKDLWIYITFDCY